MDKNFRLAHWVGKTIEVVVDKPLGATHPDHPELTYETNCGFVPGTLATDGDEIDVYVLGADGPLERRRARVVAIVRRRDDVEDRLASVVAGDRTRDAIAAAVRFQESFFDSWIELAASD